MHVLQVPFSYFPSPHGGTEVYVAALVKGLAQHGILAEVAAPGERNESYEWEGLSVHRFQVDPDAALAAMYGEGDSGAAAEFGEILDRVRPDLVHFHALTPGASVLAIREAKRRFIPLVFTYHTPTVSCMRGTMMKWGRTPCDGVMNARLCSACALHGKGLYKGVSLAMAAMSPGLLDWLGRRLGKGRFATALRLPALVRKRHAATQAAFELSDQIVAVCDWVRQVLLNNDVPVGKVKLHRQGLPVAPVALAEKHNLMVSTFSPDYPLRLAYFGRLDPTKGIQVVVEALLKKPDLPAHFDIYGIAQGDAGINWRAHLVELAAGDKRIRFHDPIESTAVTVRMRDHDLVVVPSTWLETGPLVVYEAFAAGVPVLGSRLGGIAELVMDGQNGRLLPADDATAWLDEINMLVVRPDKIAAWRANLPQARTMTEVAEEIAGLYKGCL